MVVRRLKKEEKFSYLTKVQRFRVVEVHSSSTTCSTNQSSTNFLKHSQIRLKHSMNLIVRFGEGLLLKLHCPQIQNSSLHLYLLFTIWIDKRYNKSNFRWQKKPIKKVKTPICLVILCNPTYHFTFMRFDNMDYTKILDKQVF